MQASYILLIPVILFISCKKDQQAIRSASQQSSNDIKLDTTFQFTIRQVSFFNHSPLQVQKDFYVPILDSMVSPDLKVYRTLYSTISTTWQEVFPYSQQTIGSSYVRNKGHITYSERIVLSSSIKISVRIVASW